MGLPEINITFESLAVSAIQRSQRGIVALILKDEGDFETKEYRTVADIDKDDWSEQNKDYIEKAFLGIPHKVICERISPEGDASEALRRLQNKVWNYLAFPEGDHEAIVTWIKSQRQNKKTFKAVVANEAADSEGIINFTTEGIKVGEKEYTPSQYTARIAGLLAGLSLERSATYYILHEVTDITEHADPNQAIDDGELILINDGRHIKIGRGVNSLTDVTTGKSDEWKKIKIIEGHDIIRDDITRTFEDEYVGKVINSYDNQVLFLAAVNAYLTGLEGNVLNPSHDNRIEVDVEAQRQAWLGIGHTEAEDWTDQEVKENSFRTNVFVRGSLRFLDAMEDLDMVISV